MASTTATATVSITYQVFNAKGELVSKEKSFKDWEAMEKWVTKQVETNGNFVGVEAYSR